MLDNKFHCKDCDNYELCEYYHNRKGTSLICHEFRYKAVPMENIDKMKAEIYQEAKNINRDEYTNDIQNARADGVLFALGMATGIIDKYCKENTDGTKTN